MKGARAALLRWYRRYHRDLPWRRTRDPYAIWISEAMLQQTRVETVIPYYERFLRRFPDVGSLARAEPGDVLGEWAGLGYYSRARNLKKAAGIVVERFQGKMPETAAELRSLPGIGRYTAGAIASIAFDRSEPVLDGNVTRVLARLHGIGDDVTRSAVREQLWGLAAKLARGPRPGDLNQALMELGARICTPRSPRCSECPVARFCAARKTGDPEAVPCKAPRPDPVRMRAAAVLLERRGRLLAVQRPERGLLGGLWELPGVELGSRQRPGGRLAGSLGERIGLRVHQLEQVGTVQHLFSHRRLELLVFRGRAAPGRVRLSGYQAHRWTTAGQLPELPQARVTRRAVALALGSAEES